MIKAVIFDCFGVLVSGSLEQFIAAHLNGNAELVSRARALNDAACLGEITYDDQLVEFANLAAMPVEDVREEMDGHTKNVALLSYISSDLTGRYKIGFLSNASDNWAKQMFTEADIALFDDLVMSYEVKMAKPDIRIYELAAKRLGVAPEECVFIDDIERYCVGARDAGMHALHFRDVPTLVLELEQLLQKPM